MLIHNGTDGVITVISAGNSDVVVAGKGFAEVAINWNVHTFNSDSFYVEEEGDWYATHKGESSMVTVADMEIYRTE